MTGDNRIYEDKQIPELTVNTVQLVMEQFNDAYDVSGMEKLITALAKADNLALALYFRALVDATTEDRECGAWMKHMMDDVTLGQVQRDAAYLEANGIPFRYAHGLRLCEQRSDGNLRKALRALAEEAERSKQ